MDLDKIEKRANAATEGPWELEKIGDFHDPGWMIADIIRDPKGTNALNIGTDKALGEFISSARTDVPALVARVRELEAERDLLQRQLDTAEGKRPGTWDTWAEHVARKEATPPEPPPKPHLTLEDARKQAAEHARTQKGKQ